MNLLSMCCLIKICKRLWDHKRQDMVYVNCDYASVKKEKAGAFVPLTRKWEKLLFLRLSRALPHSSVCVPAVLRWLGLVGVGFVALLVQTLSLPAAQADSPTWGLFLGLKSL